MTPFEVVDALVRQGSPEIRLEFGNPSGGTVTCWLEGTTIRHPLSVSVKDWEDMVGDKNVRARVSEQVKTAVACLEKKEEIAEVGRSLFEVDRPFFSTAPWAGGGVYVEVHRPNHAPLAQATGPDELSALDNLLYQVKRMAEY